jgi:hypothetical protein
MPAPIAIPPTGRRTRSLLSRGKVSAYDAPPSATNSAHTATAIAGEGSGTLLPVIGHSFRERDARATLGPVVLVVERRLAFGSAPRLPAARSSRDIRTADRQPSTAAPSCLWRVLQMFALALALARDERASPLGCLRRVPRTNCERPPGARLETCIWAAPLGCWAILRASLTHTAAATPTPHRRGDGRPRAMGRAGRSRSGGRRRSCTARACRRRRRAHRRGDGDPSPAAS